MSNIPAPIVTVVPTESWTLLTEASQPVSEKALIYVTTPGLTDIPAPAFYTTFTSVYVDAAGAVMLLLPAAINLGAGMQWLIKDTSGNASSNNITIEGNGYDLDQSSSFVINANNGDITLEWNGTAMSIIT